jgi:hypothetical protein
MTTTIDIAPFLRKSNLTASIICECKTCKEEAKLSLTIHCCKEHSKKIIEAIEEIEEMEEGLAIKGWE